MTRYAMHIIVAVALAAVLVGVMRVQRFYRDSPRFCESCHNVAPEIAVWLESEHRAVRCQSCHHTTLEDGVRILIATVTGREATTGHAQIAVASCSQCHAHHDNRWPGIANSKGHQVHTAQRTIECVECHGRQMHFGRPVRTTCAGCHHGMNQGLAHEESHCLACHNFLSTEANHFIPGRRECLHCHLRQERPIVIDNAAPMRFICSGCHRPHAGDEITPCSECHPADELHGLHRSAGHAPRSPGRREGEQAANDRALSSPAPGGHQSVPRTGQLNDGTAACLQCHTAHAWVSGEDPCRKCHADRPAHHPEGGCVRCHSFERDGIEENRP